MMFLIWSAQKSHGRGEPLELSDTLNREGGGVAVRFVDGHLPEAESQVDGRWKLIEAKIPVSENNFFCY